MKIFLTFLTFSALVNLCACGYNGPRMFDSPMPEPASENEEILDREKFEERMSLVYGRIMSSEKPEEELKVYIERLVRIYFRTTYYIQRFDEELKNSQASFSDLPFLMESQSYIRIQASRKLFDRLQDKIVWIYARLNRDRLEASRQSSGSLSINRDLQKLSNLRRVFHKILREQDNEALYAMELLSERLLEVYYISTSEMVTNSQGPREDRERKNFSSYVDRVKKRLGVRFGQKHQERIQRRVQESSQDEELTREVESTVNEIRESFSNLGAPSSERIPAQSTKLIYPSTGVQGNIVGRNFPERTWTLTYDDGPHATHSDAIMKDLERAGFRGTFFWLGRTLRGASARPLVERARRGKHVLANHSETHADLSKATGSNEKPLIDREIVQPHSWMTQLYGFEPNIFRCPYGSCTRTAGVRQKLADMGYVHAFWAVDSLDWNKSANPQGAASITERVRQQMDRVGRGIILYHDIHPQSVESSAQIIRLIQSRRDRHVDLCRAIDETNGDWPVNQAGRYQFCNYMN